MRDEVITALDLATDELMIAADGLLAEKITVNGYQEQLGVCGPKIQAWRRANLAYQDYINNLPYIYIGGKS
jgi:hypothetical protein